MTILLLHSEVTLHAGVFLFSLIPQSHLKPPKHKQKLLDSNIKNRTRNEWHVGQCQMPISFIQDTNIYLLEIWFVYMTITIP